MDDLENLRVKLDDEDKARGEFVECVTPIL